MNEYCVYMHRNKINDKCYIGVTKQKPEARWGPNGRRYKDSPKFYKAIQKYGWDNFDHIILETKLSQDMASEKEQKYIKEYNSIENGYNLTSGGEKHYIFTDEVKEKIRKQKMGEKNPMFGKHKTEAERKAHGEKMAGGKNPAARKVLCVEKNIVYDCCRDAAEGIEKDRVRGRKMYIPLRKG